MIQGVEWVIGLLIIGILLFGNKKIPELARALGKSIGEFQKARREIHNEIE